MSASTIDPTAVKLPLTVFFDPTSGYAADVQTAKEKDKAGQIILVDATSAGFKPADFGIPADAAGKGKICGKDAAGNVLTDSDTLFAAFSADGLAEYFRYVRKPGFHCTNSGSSFGNR